MKFSIIDFPSEKKNNEEPQRNETGPFFLLLICLIFYSSALPRVCMCFFFSLQRRSHTLHTLAFGDIYGYPGSISN